MEDKGTEKRVNTSGGKQKKERFREAKEDGWEGTSG